MPLVYLSVDQVAEIILLFPEAGYLRVQLITTVFSHIIDIENFSLLYDVILTPDERLEVIFRLGMLNVFDPMNPDREFKLDLRHWDGK